MRAKDLKLQTTKGRKGKEGCVNVNGCEVNNAKEKEKGRKGA